MRIDSHVHLVGTGWIHEDFFLGYAKIVSAIAGKNTAIYPNPVQLMDVLRPALADTTGEKLVKAMDGAGVDMSCIFPVDFGYMSHHARVSIQDQNSMVHEAARNYPERLVPFFAIDPRRPEAVTMFEDAIEKWNVRGLKLHPAVGFFASEPECHALYEKCLEYDLPVIIHTGSQPAPFKSRYCRPVYIDDVAADFPGLKIIMAHAGYNWWEEAILVGSVKPNVHYDFSGWQRAFKLRPEVFYRMLRRLIDEVGPWRVFFGSDGPYLNMVCPLDKWVAAIEHPDLSPCPEITFTDDEKTAIMGESFARLLGLDV